MNSKLKLDQKDANFLIGRLMPIKCCIDVLKKLNSNIDLLNNSTTRDFFGFVQNLAQEEIQVGLYAVLSGSGFEYFLQSDQPHLLQQLNELHTQIKYQRDKYYAHMDFGFNSSQVPIIPIEKIEKSINQILSIINEYAPTKTLLITDDVTLSLRHSLQALINLVQKS